MLTLTGTPRVAKASNLVKHAEEEQRRTSSLSPRWNQIFTGDWLPHDTTKKTADQQRGEPVIQLHGQRMKMESARAF